MGHELMFSKVLIANRGEIAVRVGRTCRDLGIATVAVFSDPDARARHVALADDAVHLPGSSPADTYLNVGAIVEAARRTGAEAVHPGYGFLSERADAAEAFADAGIVWIGPPPEALRLAGDKVQARRLAGTAGVAPVPGTMEPVEGAEEVIAFGDRGGYPIAIKAAGGGGGRGLKVAYRAEDVPAALESATREAAAYFGYGDVYLERYLPAPKHIEVQVLSEGPGGALWLGGGWRTPARCSAATRSSWRRLLRRGWPTWFPRWARRAPQWRTRAGTSTPEPSSSWSTRTEGSSISWRSTPGFRSSTPSPRRYSAWIWWPPSCGSPPASRSDSNSVTCLPAGSSVPAGTPWSAGSTPRIHREVSCRHPDSSRGIGSRAARASAWTRGSARAMRSRGPTTA